MGRWGQTFPAPGSRPSLPASCASGQPVMALSRHSQYTAPFRQLGLAQSLSQGPLCDSRGPGLFFFVAACEALYLMSARNRLWNVTPGDISSHSQFESTIWTILRSVVHTLQTRRRGKAFLSNCSFPDGSNQVSSQKGPWWELKTVAICSIFPLSYRK